MRTRTHQVFHILHDSCYGRPRRFLGLVEATTLVGWQF
jgi:hypothetical protein